jgi:hypothetical protein
LVHTLRHFAIGTDHEWEFRGSESAKKVAEIDVPLLELGTLTFEHSDNVVPDCECDRLVYSNNVLLAASFITTPGQMKAIRAILHARRGKVAIRANNFSAQYPSKSGNESYRRFSDPRMEPDEKGYNLWVHKLDYGKIHATVVSKEKDLIMYVSPESVWNRLMDSESYETPLIREWMPFVTGKLVELKHLRECRCFRANAAVLDIKKRENLDDIVLDGLKAGLIRIP